MPRLGRYHAQYHCCRGSSWNLQLIYLPPTPTLSKASYLSTLSKLRPGPEPLVSSGTCPGPSAGATHTSGLRFTEKQATPRSCVIKLSTVKTILPLAQKNSAELCLTAAWSRAWDKFFLLAADIGLSHYVEGGMATLDQGCQQHLPPVTAKRPWEKSYYPCFTDEMRKPSHSS